MGRSLPLVVVVAVVIFSLLMEAPPALSAAIRPPVRIGRYSIISARVRKQIGNFLKKHAWDIFQNVLSVPGGGGQKQGDLDTKAADTAGLYVFNLSVGTSVLQNITGILDITTELVWTQCPCSADDTCLPPPATTFQPSSSDTFAGVPCNSRTCQNAITLVENATTASVLNPLSTGSGTGANVSVLMQNTFSTGSYIPGAK